MEPLYQLIWGIGLALISDYIIVYAASSGTKTKNANKITQFIGLLLCAITALLIIGFCGSIYITENNHNLSFSIFTINSFAYIGLYVLYFKKSNTTFVQKVFKIVLLIILFLSSIFLCFALGRDEPVPDPYSHNREESLIPSIIVFGCSLFNILLCYYIIHGNYTEISKTNPIVKISDLYKYLSKTSKIISGIGDKQSHCCPNCGNIISNNAKYCSYCGNGQIISSSSSDIISNTHTIFPSTLIKSIYAIWVIANVILLILGDNGDGFWPNRQILHKYKYNYNRGYHSDGQLSSDIQQVMYDWDLYFYGWPEFFLYVIIIPASLYLILKLCQSILSTKK